MLTAVLLGVLAVLIGLIVYKECLQHRWTYPDIPAVPGRLPFVGNVLNLSKIHLILTEWSKKYGAIFRFNLHGEEIVVLNDYESIYEALVVNGSDVAGRPYMQRTEYAHRNQHSIVWQTYTPKLQFLRKTVHSAFRTYGGGLARLQASCYTETSGLLARIEKFGGKPFDPWLLFYDSACNIMLDLALGIRLSRDDPDFGLLREINRLFNHSFGPGSSKSMDALSWANAFKSREWHDMKAALAMRDSFWEKHKTDRLSSSSVVSNLRKRSKTDQHLEFDISDNTLKETFTNLILAGTDTTTTALTCFLLILLHHTDIQTSLHAEVDRVVGPSRTPALADRPAMPYLEACLMETLRFISHIPLAVPHATICDTTICGRRIPKHTTVYINLWSLHHDENFWEDPWSFNPDRFLQADGQLVLPHHENRKRLMAFGAGRRVCLGESLAKNRLFLFASALLQKFKFTTEHNRVPPELDPKNFSLGIVLHPELFKIRAARRQIVVDTS